MALNAGSNRDQDFQYRPTPSQGQHIARRADVTLAAFDDFQMDYSGYYDDLGPDDGIGSQDYALPLDFGPQPGEEEPIEGSEAPGPEDETMSIEVGREAAPPRAPRESIDSRLFGQGRDEADIVSTVSRVVSEQPFDDFGLGAGDLTIEGLTFDDVVVPVISDREKTPGQTTRACQYSSLCSYIALLTHLPASPLTEPPQTPPDIQATPQPVEKAKRRVKEKKAIVDEETEMPGARTGRGAGVFARNDRDISDILTQHQYLPRSALVMQLMEIRNDPLAYFMPTKVTPQGTFVYAGPPGLSGELAEMFMRPALPTPGKKQPKPPSTGKKRKVSGRESEGDEEVERVRKRAHVPESIGVPSEALGRMSLEPGLEFETAAPVEEFQMPVVEDVPMPDVSVEQEQIPRGRSTSIAPSHRSRMSTPALENPPFDETEPTYADSTCPIAMFDERGASSQAPSEGETQRDGKGYSRNTIKALGLIRGELQVEEGGAEGVMSFNEMANKVNMVPDHPANHTVTNSPFQASRRAASAFFFELLVLSTKDCIKLTQEEPFENIEIRAKDKLWADQRGLSVAPTSSLGGSGSQS